MTNIEEAILGALLQDIDAFDRVEKIITEDCFTSRKTRTLYKMLRSMFVAGEAVDLLTLHARLERDGLLGDIDAGYIASLTTIIPTAANVEYYATQVKEVYVRKALKKIGTQLVDNSEDMTKKTDELIEKAERLIFEMNEIQTGQYVHASVPLFPAVDLIEAYHRNPGGYLGIPCGLHDLDEILSGFQAEDLVVIGARASIGKTALALTMAANIAKDKPVGFFSLEMSSRALLIRLISMYGRIPNTRIRHGMMTKPDFDSLDRAGNIIQAGKMYIYDKANASISDIKAKARRMKKREGVEIIFVDYVGLITPDDRSAPRHEQISTICKDLKNLAREIRVPIIALAQLNRLAEGKKPGLAELKESGALEEDADIVMLMHRERGVEGENLYTEVNIAKHRNGPTCAVSLVFLPQFTKFEAYAGDKPRGQ